MWKLKPLSKRILAQIESIVSGIEQGRLLHAQYNYAVATTCGTAHCIAGWHIEFKYRAHKKKWPLLPMFLRHVAGEFARKDPANFSITNIYAYEWSITAYDWRLTQHEQQQLLRGTLKLPEIRHTLDRLKKGHRLFMGHWITNPREMEHIKYNIQV